MTEYDPVSKALEMIKTLKDHVDEAYEEAKEIAEG